MTKRGLSAFRETDHRVHDYRYLVRRWRTVARGAGLRLEEFAQQGEYPVYCLRTRSDPLEGGLYVSAGIHGDEPAGAEGLLRWAEAHLATHVRGSHGVPLFIAPCLNPWGLVNNRRSDTRGRDLNRLFDQRIPHLSALRRLICGHRFRFTLHLHEDYDARGAYLYEVADPPMSWGADLLRASVSRALPVETRRRIDDWRFKDGLLAQVIRPEDAPQCPEALYLLLHHSAHVCTFETPSEFGLSHRVWAHVRLIRRCLQLLEHPEQPKHPETKRGAKRAI